MSILLKLVNGFTELSQYEFIKITPILKLLILWSKIRNLCFFKKNNKRKYWNKLLKVWKNKIDSDIIKKINAKEKFFSLERMLVNE